MSDDCYDEPDCICIIESKRAILVLRKSQPTDRRELWVPKEVLHEDSEVYKEGDEGKLVVETWWAEKKGLL